MSPSVIKSRRRGQNRQGQYFGSDEGKTTSDQALGRGGRVGDSCCGVDCVPRVGPVGGAKADRGDPKSGSAVVVGGLGPVVRASGAVEQCRVAGGGRGARACDDRRDSGFISGSG